MSQVLQDIRQYLRDHNLKGLWVTKTDQHNSEYGHEKDNYISFVTGFKGSTGLALVLLEKAYLFVDGRYTLQARSEVNQNLFEIRDYRTGEIKKVLESIGHNDAPMGVIEGAITLQNSKTYSDFSKLQPLNPQFLDDLWSSRPQADYYAITPHPIALSGISAEKKIHDLKESLTDQKVQGIFLNEPCEIAWLLNLRSPDRPMTPAAPCFAFVAAKGAVHLWTHPQEWDASLMRDHLSDVIWHPYGEVENFLNSLQGQKIWIDGRNLSWGHARTLEACGAELFDEKSPLELAKAIKNPAEIKGMVDCHRQDGAALSTFMAWLSKQDVGHLSEMDVVEKLFQFRKERNHFCGVSFDTIAGFGARGAIIHYHPTQSNHSPLNHENLLLIDSGGQYLNGTTDVTRTLYLGFTPTSRQKEHYTRVLKGHIALALAVFPERTTGGQIDSFARQYLWQDGLDYAHGTGHGVGSFLGVHEGPQSISSHPNPTPLQVGMVLSNEPGFYLEDQYGIRLESLIHVIPAQFKGYLKFETLTLAPFEPLLINFDLLSTQERAWLQAYHKRILEELSPLIDSDTRAYLEQMVEKFSQ